MIIYSSRTDFEARLRAVRAGADAYLLKSLDSNYLVSKNDEFLGRSPKRPYQIMMVDDDVNLARYHALLLRHAGMQVQVVNRPEDVLNAM